MNKYVKLILFMIIVFPFKELIKNWMIRNLTKNLRMIWI